MGAEIWAKVMTFRFDADDAVLMDALTAVDHMSANELLRCALRDRFASRSEDPAFAARTREMVNHQSAVLSHLLD